MSHLIPTQMQDFYPSKVRQPQSSLYCKNGPTSREHSVHQQAVYCKEFTSLRPQKNFKLSCPYGRPGRAETRLGSTLTTDFSIPESKNPACKHALKAKLSSEGTKKAGRLERQLVKKKAVTLRRAGGSFLDNQCLGF